MSNLRISHTLSLLLAALLLAGCGATGAGGGGLLSHVPGVRTFDGFLPEADQVPGLKPKAALRTFRGKGMEDYLGRNAALFINYGAEGLAVREYEMGGADHTLSIEAFDMNGQVAAAGLYHFHRGKKLADAGVPVDVGAEGVLDRTHENRNLYFYKNRCFYKLIYTGPVPVPDLVAVGKMLAERVPGSPERPRGFQYLDLEGVDSSTAQVTPGYTFNCEFLPPGIFAKAPGAGPIAEVFLIGHFDDDDAAKTAKDYQQYLTLHGLDYSLKHRPNRRIYWWAKDPDQGRVICSRYKNYVVGVVRPKSYELGETLLERLIDRIEQDRSTGMRK